MRTSMKNQLNQWRKVNKMETMQDLLKKCTYVVENKKEGIWALVVPHRKFSIKNSDVMKFYMNYRLEMIQLKGKLRGAVANKDVMEALLLEQDMLNLSKEFFDTMREITGETHVMGINHDEQDLKQKGLIVHVYPIEASDKPHFTSVVRFEHKETGEVKEETCLLIPYRKGGKK